MKRMVVEVYSSFCEVSYKQRLWPRASSLIEEETSKKRILQRRTSIEIRYSIFCGSLFSPAVDCQISQFIVPLGEGEKNPRL